MVDEHKLLREADRASKVQALIENEFLKEAFESLERAYIEKWRSTDLLDSISREKLYMKVAALNDVIAHLGTILSDGKLAAHQLKSLAEQPNRSGIL